MVSNRSPPNHKRLEACARSPVSIGADHVCPLSCETVTRLFRLELRFASYAQQIVTSRPGCISMTRDSKGTTPRFGVSKNFSWDSQVWPLSRLRNTIPIKPLGLLPSQHLNGAPVPNTSPDAVSIQGPESSSGSG